MRKLLIYICYVLFAMVLYVPLNSVKAESVSFGEETIVANDTEPAELADLSSSTSSNKNYKSYMEAYFRGLTQNMGFNSKGSCGYVALGQILSYYDSYLDDDIIPEQYDVASKGVGTNMIERNDSPGVMNDYQSGNFTNQTYYNRMKLLINSSLHARLMAIGEELDFLKIESSNPFGTTPQKREAIFDTYLSQINKYGYSISASQYYEELSTKPVSERNNLIIEFSKKHIDMGVPVILSAKNSANKQHAMVCYAYNGSVLYGNMGWANQKEKSYYNVSDMYPLFNDATAFVISGNHTHSYNYEVTQNGLTQKYCYCNSNIMTYTGDMIKFDEPVGFDGNFVVPNWVTSIGENVFANNLNLKSVKFEEGCEITDINANAFRGCANLEYIKIPKSLKTIGDSAFSYCTSLRAVDFDVDCGLTRIGDNAFSYCSSLVNMRIPCRVISIGRSAFTHCNNLLAIDFAENSALETIGSYAFEGAGIESISFPSSLRRIEEGAFMFNENLKSVVIPSTVTEIGESAVTGGGVGDLGKITIYTDCLERPVGWHNHWNAIADSNSIIADMNNGTYDPNNIEMYYVYRPVFWDCTLSIDNTYVKTFYNKDTDNSITHKENGVESPSRVGYIFDGWYLNENFDGDAYTTEQIASNESKNLYIPKWTPRQFGINYKDMGRGEFSGVHENGYSTNYVYTITAELDTPVKIGYSFNGWYLDDACKILKVNEISAYTYMGDITVYAKWDPITYTITYCDVGDTRFSGTHSNRYPTRHTFGTKTILDTPSKPDAYFAGWYTNADGSGIAITSLSATDFTSDIILYAKWSDSYIDLDPPEITEPEISTETFRMGFLIPDVENFTPQSVYKIGDAPQDDFSYAMREATFPALTRLTTDGYAYELNTSIVRGFYLSDEHTEANVTIFNYLCFSDGDRLTAQNFKDYFDLRQSLSSYPCSYIYEIETVTEEEFILKFTTPVNTDVAYHVMSELRALPACVTEEFTFSSLEEVNAMSFTENFYAYGKFYIDSYVTGQKVTLCKNEYYLAPVEFGIDRLEILFFANRENAYLAYANDQTDELLDLCYAVPRDQIDYLKNYCEDEFYIFDSRVRIYLGVGKNSELMADGVDRRLIQALGYAIDYDAITYVLELVEIRERNGWFPDNMPDGIGGCVGDSMSYQWTKYKYEMSLAWRLSYAQSLLDDAGYHDGLTLSLCVPNDEFYIEIGRVIQQSFMQINIQVNMIASNNEQTRQNSDLCLGFYDFTGGYVSDTGEFIEDYANWLLAANPDEVDGELLGVVEQLFCETDVTKRQALLQTFHDLLVEQGVKIGYVNSCYLLRSEYAPIAPKLFNAIVY